MNTYFRDPHPELSQLIDNHLERLRKGCPEPVKGQVALLVLGGGYGRGEGGVLQQDGNNRLFNDLDYFLFSADSNNPELIAWVRQWEKSETELLGIDVECVILPDRKLRNPEMTMMFSDLAHGHVHVMGDESAMLKWPEILQPKDIPLSEATRLLWNRGSGLYFACCQLTADEPDREFVLRNHAKLKLALGDAVLCRHKLYCAYAAQRGERLENIDDPLLTEEISAWHREGVEFKYHPHCGDMPLAQLVEQQASLCRAWETVFLEIESQRLNIKPGFSNLQAYAEYPGRLFPDSPVPRNLLLALRDRLRRNGGLRPVWDYPRGGLYRALAELIDSLSHNKPCRLSRWITETESGLSPGEYENVFLKWWHCYS